MEWFLGILLLLLMAQTYSFFVTQGFLPPPFFQNYFDTLMDGYNTAAWAHRSGAYDVWRSIYPPLSFAWFKVFSLPGCYVGTEVFARDCDWWFKVALLGFAALNLPIVFLSYWKMDTATALPRSLAVAAGMPMLYAIERGNLIVFAFTFFALGHGPLLASARLRWLSAAMAANFKPYLLAPVLIYAAARRWRWLEGALIACALVYLLSYMVVGDGSPLQVLRNTITFADSTRTADWAVSFYASSYLSLDGFLRTSRAPVLILLGSQTLDVFRIALPLLMRVSQLLTILAIIGAYVRPAGIPRHRLIALATLFAITSTETGGYAACFALFLVFMERWKGPLLISALLLAYLLSLCYDYFLVQLGWQLRSESYLGGRPVSASYGLAVGTIVRPAALLLIMDLLALETLTTVARTFRGARRRLLVKPEPITGESLA